MPRSSSSRSDNKRDRQDRKISNNRRERSKTFSGIPTAEIREVVSLFFKKWWISFWWKNQSPTKFPLLASFFFMSFTFKASIQV